MRFQDGMAWFAAAALCCTSAWGQVFSSPQALKSSSNAPSSTILPTGQARLPLTGTTTPAQKQVKRAEVTFANGRLAIKAENSSLNLILREIGRQTGIKITGGVNEERVFGNYGPDAPDTVLTKLLDGTGSNVLLIASEGSAPGELILTPRMGGPTPPNPNARGFDDDSGEDDAPRTPAPRGVSLFGGAQPTAPQAEAPVQQPQQQTTPFPPITTPSVPAPTDGGTAAPANSQSPNGVKTPQEIYQQLQQLRQQQQQQQQAEPPN